MRMCYGFLMPGTPLRADPVDVTQFDAASELLRALANPHRVAIVMELAAGERCVHDLVDALGVAQPLISQHLRVLRAERLVKGRRRGREVAYELIDGHIAHIVRDAVSHSAERTSP
jgi:DNA-binding transcriptional ArsR family regulator